jgi:hypothetical protein
MKSLHFFENHPFAIFSPILLVMIGRFVGLLHLWSFWCGGIQLLITIDDITRNMEEGDQTDIILLDFAKAFDKVPHDRLLHKMEFYGVQQNTLESSMVISNWDSQDRLTLNPCCSSQRNWWRSKWSMMELWTMCSNSLHAIEVSDTGR